MMDREYRFDRPEDFLHRLRELLAAGAKPQDLRIRTPYRVEEAEALIFGREGWMRLFPLAGGITGFGGGLALTVYSVLSWPLITGGKPIVSLPPFLLIGYLMVILFGSLATFAGFLLLARLPRLQAIVEPAEFAQEFVIVVGQRKGD